jgi:hypothetical protein
MPRVKNSCRPAVAAEGRFPTKTVAELIGVSRSNLIGGHRTTEDVIGRPPLPDDKLVAEIKANISRISFTPRVHRSSRNP